MNAHPSEKLPFPSLLDSSMLATFKSCPAKFFMEYVQNFKSRGISVHLHAGGAFAKGMEVARKAFYTGHHDQLQTVGTTETGESLSEWREISCVSGDADYAIGAGLGALLSYYGNFECPDDSAKSANRMAGAFEYYFDNYPLSNDDGQPVAYGPENKRAIEFSFAHPLPITRPDTGEPIVYCGRMDSILAYTGGTFICDEKTTSQLGATWSRQWDLRSQFTGYAWGSRESGLKVDGVIVRGVSILKTKYETQQAISYRPQWLVDQWYDELLSWVNDIKMCWQTGRWVHNYDHACAEYGGCGFKTVCQSEDPAKWLEVGFERRVWNPLLRTEKAV